MITSGTVLIENEIFNSKKETIKVAMSKLWLVVYCVSSIQIHEQILEFGLRVEGDKSSSTFYNKSSNAVQWTTPNFWGNIQIVRIYILEYNISNSMSFIIRYLEFKTLHHCFRHISDEVICYFFDNVEDTKKIFQHRNISIIVVLLKRCINTVSLKTLFTSVSV